jgi:hypothetical protein
MLGSIGKSAVSGYNPQPAGGYSPSPVTFSEELDAVG